MIHIIYLKVCKHTITYNGVIRRSLLSYRFGTQLHGVFLLPFLRLSSTGNFLSEFSNTTCPFHRFKYINISLPLLLLGEGGFEPPKALPADLQSVPFGHSGIPPYNFIYNNCSSSESQQLFMGFENCTIGLDCTVFIIL